ncbi:hypothetical protein T265_13040, partial [Opisthorchis viverrini]
MFYLKPNCTKFFEKYTHLQINLVFTRGSAESLVYDVLSWVPVVARRACVQPQFIPHQSVWLLAYIHSTQHHLPCALVVRHRGVRSAQNMTIACRLHETDYGLTNTLLTRLLKTLRQSTTGLALLEDYQSPSICQPYVLLETKLHEIREVHSFSNKFSLPKNILNEIIGCVP